MMDKVNLLEGVKEIIESNDKGHYDLLRGTIIGIFSPLICKALLDSMKEIEDKQLESGNWDIQRGMLNALDIIRKHLGAE
jgi:hypothetical protein